MAISISDLVPAKEATGVLLSSSISFTITSDDADLVASSIVFTINGIEANISITQNSATDFDFSRSIADLHYGQEYVCTITIEDADGTIFFDSFPFIAEEGIFVNNNFRKYNYFQTTQELANFLPESTKARYDRFSNFQQLYNKFGATIEELDRALIKQLSSYYVQTADLNDLSILYKVELPGNFKFPESLLDDGTLLFKSPDIYGYQGFTKFNIDPDFNNDLFSFYFGKIPDRIDLGNSVSFTANPILSTTSVTAQPILVEEELAIPGGFVLTLSGVSKFVRARSDGSVLGLTAIIKGESIFGKSTVETITFISNGEVFSKKQWNRIDSIEFFDFPDIDNITGTVKIDYHPAAKSFVKDIFKYSNIDRTDFIKWNIADGPEGSLLQTYIPRGRDVFSQVIDPLDDLVREYELFDTDNSTPVSLIDFTADLFAEKIYGVDSDYLYLFNKLEEYPSGLNILTKITPDLSTIIELQASELARTDEGKEISFKAIQTTFGKKVVSYRFRLLKPDGNYVSIGPDGSVSSDTNFIPVFNSKTNFNSPVINYSLTAAGDYYLFLETRYVDGTYDRDIKIIRNLKKSAIAKYKLDKYLSGATPVKLFVDFDQKVKLLDSSDFLHEIEFHRDNVLINFEDKILFFNENYDSVEVI